MKTTTHGKIQVQSMTAKDDLTLANPWGGVSTDFPRASVVIYTCKACKVARRVEYPAGNPQVPRGVWVSSSGGGLPTVYGGDVKNGVCTCGRMMSFDKLKARYRPEIECDARCTHARGASCNCSCGGMNHATKC